MRRQDAYKMYCAEVAQFEKYGTTGCITFEDWCVIKNICIIE